MINVITIESEYRSSASDIARKLGARLGWKVWDEQLRAEIARQVECVCGTRVAERVVVAAAKQGRAILVERGSAYYLHDRQDAFHVFIHTPFEDKVRRLQSTGVSEHEAAALVATVDRDCAAFMQQHVKASWPDWQLFHLLISSAIGHKAIVDRILHGIVVVEELSQRPAGLR